MVSQVVSQNKITTSVSHGLADVVRGLVCSIAAIASVTALGGAEPPGSWPQFRGPRTAWPKRPNKSLAAIRPFRSYGRKCRVLSPCGQNRRGPMSTFENMPTPRGIGGISGRRQLRVCVEWVNQRCME